MSDLLLRIMGALDILAGILIMVAFHASTLSLIFGIIMILKGGISLAG